jgi:phage FluMu protein Com
MNTAKTPASERCQGSETRCECGQLIAKVVEGGLELKCKRCKRIVLIPFSAIEGAGSLAS